MIHKFCENHLVELYEAIKADEIGEIKKIEHELSPSEECVACAYAFKAKGEAREVLGEYLRSEGFAVESSTNESILSAFWFWAITAKKIKSLIAQNQKADRILSLVEDSTAKPSLLRYSPKTSLASPLALNA